MMPRRLFGPVGRWLLFLLVCGLVIGGLGWVTYASLGVESAQRAAAADADRTGKERLALWRLDGKLLPTLGVENFRRFEDYTALSPGPDPVNSTNYLNPIGNALTLNNTGLVTANTTGVRYVSPLASARLEPWMILHVQFDPELGWQSPQVMPPDLVRELTDEPNWVDLSNVTDERRTRLAELNRVLPARFAAKAFAEFDPGRHGDSATPVTVGIAPLRLDRLIGLDLLARLPAYKRLSDEFSQWVQTPPTGPSPAVDAAKSITPAQDPKSRAVANGPSPATVPAPGDTGFKDVYSNRGGQSGAGNTAQGAQNPGRVGPSFNDQAQRDMAVKGAEKAGESRGQQQAVLSSQLPGPVPAEGGPGNPTSPPAVGTGGPAGPGTANPTGIPSPPPGPPGGGQGGFGGFGGGGFGGSPRGVAGGGGGGGGGRGGVAGRPGNTDPNKDDRKPAAPTPGAKVENPPAGRTADQKVGLAGALPPAAARAMPDAELKEKLAKEAKQGNERGITDGAEEKKIAKADEAAGTRGSNFGKDLLPQKADDAEKEKKDTPPARRGPPAGVQLGTMRPVWLTDVEGHNHLLFFRVATLTSKTVYQAVVIDWPALRDELIAEVTDLFPAATLTQVTEGQPRAPERSMAALPAELDPGPAPALPPAGWTTLRIGLALAWVAALVALAAVWFGGWSLVDLSERRIRFVSAVTHELRTPLTSLRLYLDMLTSGMVKEEQKKQEYLGTLSTESDRLNRLIENVLDFSRLERRSANVVRESVPVADLLARVRETWAERLAADGKDLQVVGTVPPDQRVTADSRMVEQILGNLVDNARKYAREAADPRVWVWAKPAGRRWLAFEVEDRGPGVPLAERRTIFRPFRRGAEADTTAGGAGLGLALAKQWAELCGGRLSYRPAEGGTGACFRLELPVGVPPGRG